MSSGGRTPGGGGQRSGDGGRIDLAIDGAVREMLDVQQPAGVRSRVLRRIEGDPSVVASAFRRKDILKRKILWLGMPLAAAAILILAVLLPRSPGQPSATTAARVEDRASPVTTPPPTPRMSPATINPRSPSVGSPRVVARRAPQPTTHPDEGRQPAHGMVAAAMFGPAENATTEIAPLKTITPIQVTPVADQTIAPADIAVRPLNPMNELAIAPLTPPERRN